MESLGGLFHIDLLHLIETIGYVGMFALVFGETGFFFGFFLPGGESLLFSAGLLASQGIFNIWILLILFAVAALGGDSMGYFLGTKIGLAIFTREDSLLFRKRYVEETRRFYAKHGAYTIILARFVPIVRTFAPLLAGVGKMKYDAFLRFNVIGGLLWSVGITLLGYFLGNTFPLVSEYLTEVILGIIVLSFVPIALKWYKERYRKGAPTENADTQA